MASRRLQWWQHVAAMGREYQCLSMPERDQVCRVNFIVTILLYSSRNMDKEASPYYKKLAIHICALSDNQTNFEEAAQEWEFWNETLANDGEMDCPCGHQNIHVLCHIHNLKTQKHAIVGNECIKWFGPRLETVARLAKSLLSVKGVYIGPTSGAGFREQFQVHGSLAIIKSAAVVRDYFPIDRPFLRVSKRWRLFVYDRRPHPAAPLHKGYRYVLRLEPRMAKNGDKKLILEMHGAHLPSADEEEDTNK